MYVNKMERPVGIIQVPIEAFEYLPGVGRDLDHQVVNNLTHLFRRVKCHPKSWVHHVAGLIDVRTYYEILTALTLSRQQFSKTVNKGAEYRRLSLQAKSIICLQGKHRLAAAKKVFGKQYFWTVRLYCPRGKCKIAAALTKLNLNR